MLTCKSCGAELDLSMSACASCGADAPLGRLAAILGIVCRRCDAYNDPGAKTCIACGEALGASSARPPAPLAGEPPAAAAEAPASAAPSAGRPAGQVPERQRPSPYGWPEPPPAASPQGPPAVRRPSPPPAIVATLARPAPAAALMCPSCGADGGANSSCPSCGRPLGLGGADYPAVTPAIPSVTPVPMPDLEPPTPGEPVSPLQARLVLEHGEAAEGSVFPLSGDEVQLGRSTGQVLFPDDPCLAPHHATFFYRDGQLQLRDEGAAGGVFLRLRGLSVPLRPGSLFAVGDRLLRFAGPLPPPPPTPADGTKRLGAPRPSGSAVLVEEWLEGGVGGRVFLRTGPSVTIGRAGCSINLGDDPYLSQAHAEIVLDAGGTAKLRDLGSSNGTFVRIPPGSERELHDGDSVRIGREVLRIEAGGT